MVWSKASHLMSRKWVFCGMMCNLLCKSRKTIHEKSRFKALKTWIIHFFECNNLLRIQDGPFNPKYLHFDFWFDTPLEQCALWNTLGTLRLAYKKNFWTSKRRQYRWFSKFQENPPNLTLVGTFANLSHCLYQNLVRMMKRVCRGPK